MAISIEDLRSRVALATNNASVQAAKRSRAKRWREKLRAEAESAGFLFNVSRLSLLVEEFPERIPDLAIVFHHGEWLRETGLLLANPRGQRATVLAVLDDLGIGVVPNAVQAVVDLVGWDMATLGEDLVAAAGRLPDHVIDALFHLDVDEMAVVFDVATSSLPFDHLADAARRLEVSFGREDEEPWSKLATFATPAGLPYLKALAARGVVVDDTTMAAAARFRDIGVVDALLDLGVAISAVGGSRFETALHVAVAAALDPHCSGEAVAFAHGLVKRGINPRIRNLGGKTAMDVLSEGIEMAYSMGEEENLDMMLLEELLGVIRASAKIED